MGLERRLRLCIADKLPGAVDAAGPQSQVQPHCAAAKENLRIRKGDYVVWGHTAHQRQGREVNLFVNLQSRVFSMPSFLPGGKKMFLKKNISFSFPKDNTYTDK